MDKHIVRVVFADKYSEGLESSALIELNNGEVHILEAWIQGGIEEVVADINAGMLNHVLKMPAMASDSVDIAEWELDNPESVEIYNVLF